MCRAFRLGRYEKDALSRGIAGVSRKALFLRHHDEDRPGLVGEAFASHDFELDVAMMDKSSPTPSVEGYDVLVILGSKHAVYDQEIEVAWFGRELDVIDEAERMGVPILGICFGAQALCVHHGGVVEPSSEPEVGWFDIEARNDSGIGAGPWFEFHFDRCTLPQEAELWATSPRAVQVFAVGKNVGVQFHPEVDDAQLADWFASGDDNGARDLGVDPSALLEQTARETPAARVRTAELVELFLRHIDRA
jgi:GMP synthase-like glutamine amidotransferase